MSFQDEFENPTVEDLNRVYHVPLQVNCDDEGEESESDRLFQHMTEMTILTVQLIVEFSKHLPGFQTLCREDQVSLLKGCSSEVSPTAYRSEYRQGGSAETASLDALGGQYRVGQWSRSVSLIPTAFSWSPRRTPDRA